MSGTRNQSTIDLEQHLAFELTRVVEEGAVAAARTMGQGDRKGSDQAAVQAMRRAFEGPAGEGPRIVILRTIKGHGVSFMENAMEWHYLPLKPDQYRAALEEVDAE